MRINNRQVTEAQFALATLLTMELPMKVSLEVARLANQVESQVNAYAKVRDVLVSKYQIEIKAADKEGEVVFHSTLPDNHAALTEFNKRLAVLVEAKTGDIKGKIHLPDIKLRPELLKPIAPFVASPMRHLFWRVWWG